MSGMQPSSYLEGDSFTEELSPVKKKKKNRKKKAKSQASPQRQEEMLLSHNRKIENLNDDEGSEQEVKRQEDRHRAEEKAKKRRIQKNKRKSYVQLIHKLINHIFPQEEKQEESPRPLEPISEEPKKQEGEGLE